MPCRVGLPLTPFTNLAPLPMASRVNNAVGTQWLPSGEMNFDEWRVFLVLGCISALLSFLACWPVRRLPVLEFPMTDGLAAEWDPTSGNALIENHVLPIEFAISLLGMRSSAQFRCMSFVKQDIHTHSRISFKKPTFEEGHIDELEIRLTENAWRQD